MVSTARTTQTTTLHVEGMDCPDEIAELRACLNGKEGISDLSFNLMRATMTIRHDSTQMPLDAILERISSTGMLATVAETGKPLAGIKTNLPRGPLVASAVALGASAAGAILSYQPFASFHHTTWPAAVCYILAIMAGWWYVLPKAVAAIRRSKLDMNVLMTVAVVGAVALGEWLEAATVAFLFLISHLLETWSVNRARRAIQSLMELSPTEAVVIDAEGKETKYEVEKVEVGSNIIVRPGEKFPLDGEIVDGETTVNQAPITGESALVGKSLGDEVFAGTVNGDGAVTVKVTKPVGDTVLAGVIRLVEQAQAQRSPSEKFVDRFARYYTPAVVVVALLLCVLPPLLFAAEWSVWLYRSLVLLVIACPCALVISTPVTIVSALAAAARQGVLIKGGEFLEAVGRATVVALDKTGTLTAGKPVVQQVIPVDGEPEERLLQIAASMEMRSEHPIAQAILAYAEAKGITTTPCNEFQAIRGKGATATVHGERFKIGNHRLLEEDGTCTDAIHQVMREHEDCHHTTVGLTSSRGPLGVILLADGLRPAARKLLPQLRESGVKQVIMLTGDSEGTAKAVAEECGGIDYRAELLPEDKVKAVEELRREHDHIVMVGDGINDAPALAVATVGIAMGAEGTDAALETADIALMTDDLAKLPWLLRHSQRARAIIIQNVSLSLGIKGIFLGLAVLGLANLWMAIAADMGASLLVTFNGLRLLRAGNN